MKILVLSDSHSSLRIMRHAVFHIRPDAVIHLGDYLDDGEVLREENPHISFHQVPGNCDRYRMQEIRQEVLCYPVCGVKLFMTHGHLHNVKASLYALLAEARAAQAQAVLYGHTHCPDCRREDGLWILNPGSCGHGGGSVGLIETEHGQITDIRILHQEDWEAYQ
ncbi:MAG: YfcE family phosphodiesterase [Ruminococcaceae bacterium]|nr:YfcE family phosphodiesterase [Oscillospiraceae bacterium]